MTKTYCKQALKEELLRVLRAELSQGERAHESTREGATHEEAKPENDKDTRALEQSYLARGQAQRVEELRLAVAEVATMPLRAFAEGQPVALGALVSADEDGATRVLFLAPHGGGAALAGGQVQVVTPKSPLGRALLGKQSDDECVVQVGGRVRSMTIVAIE
jgi:transcription elongation GreA/GreB family factor